MTVLWPITFIPKFVWMAKWDEDVYTYWPVALTLKHLSQLLKDRKRLSLTSQGSAALLLKLPPCPATWCRFNAPVSNIPIIKMTSCPPRSFCHIHFFRLWGLLRLRSANTDPRPRIQSKPLGLDGGAQTLTLAAGLQLAVCWLLPLPLHTLPLLSPQTTVSCWGQGDL